MVREAKERGGRRRRPHHSKTADRRALSGTCPPRHACACVTSAQVEAFTLGRAKRAASRMTLDQIAEAQRMVTQRMALPSALSAPFSGLAVD